MAAYIPKLKANECCRIGSMCEQNFNFKTKEFKHLNLHVFINSFQCVFFFFSQREGIFR